MDRSKDFKGRKPSKSTAPKECQQCARTKKVSWFRKKWVCDDCMLGPMKPLRIEDYMDRAGPLGDLGLFHNETPRDLSWGTPFRKALDKAMEREGWNKTQQQMKDELFAGVKTRPAIEEDKE